MNKLKTAYEAIEECLAHGMDDKVEIYNKIEMETGIPRPTIRQAAAKLKADLEKSIRKLEKEQ